MRSRAAPPQTGPPQQPSDIAATITGDGGAAPRLAVPEFIALTRDAETQAIAKAITQVLFDDLTFEREFALLPRDTYATVPAATSFNDIPFDRWRELNADGVVIGTVQKLPTGLEDRGAHVQRAHQAIGLRQGIQRIRREPSPLRAHGRGRDSPDARGFAAWRARSSTFDSDRDGERIARSVENRTVKEIYIADYDGENQRRITVEKSLNITATWSPDGRSIAYTSYRKVLPNIVISNIYQGTMEELTKDGAGSNFTPSWSPDGTRICFASNRDGNMELYVANRDGSNVRRLTNHPASDITPTWSPSGTQIAFTSDRTGTPQIYIIGADGLGLQKLTSESYADRPTWSPAPYNEIAYTARTGPG